MRRSLFLFAAVVAMWPAAANAQLSKTQALIVPDYAALEAVPFALVPNNHSVLVTEAGRGGAFVKTTANLAAIAAIDTGKCVVIPAPGTDGSSGGYVRPDWRSGKKSIDVTWCAAASGFSTATAQNRAAAILNSVGGGELVFPAGDYTYTTDTTSFGSNTTINCDARPRLTIDGTSAANISAFKFIGGAMEASRALAANIVIGDNKITVTSASSPTQIAVGDVLFIYKAHSSDIYGVYSLVTAVIGNVIYLADRMAFAVGSGETTAGATAISGGTTALVQKQTNAITGINFTGQCLIQGANLGKPFSGGVATAGNFYGIEARNVRRFRADSLVGDSLRGTPSNGVNNTSLIIASGYDIQINDTVTRQSGSPSVGDIDIGPFGGLVINNSRSENAASFGSVLRQGSNCRIGSIRTFGAGARGYKFQSTRNCGADFVDATNSTFTGLAFDNGSQGWVTRLEVGGSTSAPPVTVSSLSRASNVVTVTTATPHGITSTGQGFVISGATTTSFNATFAVASVISPTELTAAQTGSNETGTVGSAVFTRGGSESLWTNGTGVDLHIGQMRVRGPANTVADIGVYSPDRVTIDSLVTDNPLTTTGTGVIGQHLRIAQINGVDQKPAFSAHKNGVNQTVTTASAQKVTFNTEKFDINNHYDPTNSRFVPVPAGYPARAVFLECTIYQTGVSAGYLEVQIFKNGAALLGGSQLVQVSASPTLAGGSTMVVDLAQPDDNYECMVNTTASTTIAGFAAETHFSGFAIN